MTRILIYSGVNFRRLRRIKLGECYVVSFTRVNPRMFAWGILLYIVFINSSYNKFRNIDIIKIIFKI